jgi:mRNA interferase MazF
VKRGEVWWFEHPGEKRRPYLIMSRDEAIPLLHSVIAVPATSTIRDIPTEIYLSRADGMPSECVLTVDNVRTASKSFFTSRIAALSTDRMNEVCEALAFAVRC